MPRIGRRTFLSGLTGRDADSPRRLFVSSGKSRCGRDRRGRRGSRRLPQPDGGGVRGRADRGCLQDRRARTHRHDDIRRAPTDVGAHWLHYGSANPYRHYGQSKGFDIYPARDDYRIFTDGREADADEAAELWSTWDAMYEAIGRDGDNGLDVSAAESVRDIEGAWKATAAFGIGPWGMGKDLSDFSVVDWWNSPDGWDWFCREGFGTLVAHYGDGIPVSLDTPASKVRWTVDGVAVDTPKGTIHARAAIVTVSNGVLAAGDIAFDPELPPHKLEAIERVPMGFYNHIALQFSEDVFGMGPDGYLLYRLDDKEGFGTLTNAGGHGLAYCDVGGSWARALEEQPAEACVDYALSRSCGACWEAASTARSSRARRRHGDRTR